MEKRQLFAFGFVIEQIILKMSSIVASEKDAIVIEQEKEVKNSSILKNTGP